MQAEGGEGPKLAHVRGMANAAMRYASASVGKLKMLSTNVSTVAPCCSAICPRSIARPPPRRQSARPARARRRRPRASAARREAPRSARAPSPKTAPTPTTTSRPFARAPRSSSPTDAISGIVYTPTGMVSLIVCVGSPTAWRTAHHPCSIALEVSAGNPDTSPTA